MSENDPLTSPKPPIDDETSSLDAVKKWPWLEIFFLNYMALSGAVSVTVSYAISDLADNCNESATELGIVFLSEALGALVGGALSIWAYNQFYGNWVLIVAGTLLAGNLLTLPFITNSSALNLAYFCAGVFILIIQIGCIHLVRRIQREGAGHWLAMTQAAVSAGGCIFLFINWASELTLFWTFCLLSIVLWVISAGFIFVPFSAKPKENGEGEEEGTKPTVPERFYNTTSLTSRPSSTSFPKSHSQTSLSRSASQQQLQQQQQHQSTGEGSITGQDQPMPSDNEVFIDHDMDCTVEPPHYYAELVVGTAAFLMNGVNLIITSYLSTYADETGVESTSTAEYQVTVFWLCLTIGRIIGTIDQFYNVTDENIVPRTSLWILSAVGAAFLWLILWNYAFGAWMAVILLGTLGGPVIGYVFDWTHRITIPSEGSTTILLLLTFVGGHTVVYICAAIWDAGAGPRSMIVTTICVFFLAIPFMSWGRRVSYLSKFNHRAKPLYHRLSSSDLANQANHQH